MSQSVSNVFSGDENEDQGRVPKKWGGLTKGEGGLFREHAELFKTCFRFCAWYVECLDRSL